MRANDLILHCLAERHGDQWVAVCLDFSLAAQADSFQAVRVKLDAQIREYVFDAVAGPDRQHAAQLLRRRAPLRDWLKYWAYRELSRWSSRRRARTACGFRAPMPLVPATC